MQTQVADQAQPMNLEDNKQTYITKMNEQLRNVEDEIQNVSKTIKSRNADANTDVQKSVEQARNKLSELHRRFGALKTESTETWADQSRVVSSTYKELEDLIASLKSKVKPV